MFAKNVWLKKSKRGHNINLRRNTVVSGLTWMQNLYYSHTFNLDNQLSVQKQIHNKDSNIVL